MAIKDQIQRILDGRKQKVDALKEKKLLLQTIRADLKACNELYEQAEQIENEKLRKQYMAFFSQVQTNCVMEKVTELSSRIDAVIRSMSRDTINIGTVGKARQGKSKFLQSVSGLGNQVIPAYDGSFCTGATSVIHNDENMRPGEVRAVLTFRSREDIVDTVQTYLNLINPDYLNGQRLQYDDIMMINIPQLKMSIEEGNSKKSKNLKHLREILNNFSEFCELLGSAPITLTNPEEIECYVAKNNGREIDDPEYKQFYYYWAVLQADIYCRLHTDCGKIKLVDTVGLLDTQLGVEESMLRTVEQECDAAIVITQPISEDDQNDNDLYDILRKHFEKRNTELWLFYLSNHYIGRNDKAASIFANAIDNGNFAVAAYGSGSKRSKCQVINCSNPRQVEEELMIPVLTELVQNIDAIDRAYLEEVDNMYASTMDSCRKLLDSFPKAERAGAGAVEATEAFKKGQEAYREMTAALSRQTRLWRSRRFEPNTTLWNEVQDILNNLESIVPDAQFIQTMFDNDGHLLPSNMWDQSLHYIRNEITDRFVAINKTMEKETKKFKNSLIKDLYYRLKNMVDDSVDISKNEQIFDENDDMIGWLKEKIDKIVLEKPEYVQISHAVDFLSEFEFNIRAELIREVRRQLFIINPTCTDNGEGRGRGEYARPEREFQSDKVGEEVYFYLISRISIVEENLRYILLNFYKKPNEAYYAAAEELYDRLTFASNLKDGTLIDMGAIWGKFFIEYSKNWSKNEEHYQKINELIENYNQLMERLKQSVA